MKRGRVTGITARKSIRPYIAHGVPGGQGFPGVFLEWAGKGNFVYGIYRLLNRMAAEGADCRGIQAEILLPAKEEEPALRKMMQELSTACGSTGVPLLSAEALVQEALNSPAAVLMGAGRKEEGCFRRPQAGMQLLQAGPAACEGTLRLLDRHREGLEKRFCPEFLDGAGALKAELDKREAAAFLWKEGAAGVQAVSEGGIFAGLWEAAESWNLGFEADLKKILIRQETVEICEALGRNPYCLEGSGCLLACAEQGEALAEKMAEQGWTARVIGRMSGEKSRILRNREETRYLDLPAEDEIYQEEMG